MHIMIFWAFQDNPQLRILVNYTLELDGNLEVVLDDQWRLKNGIL